MHSFTHALPPAPLRSVGAALIILLALALAVPLAVFTAQLPGAPPSPPPHDPTIVFPPKLQPPLERPSPSLQKVASPVPPLAADRKPPSLKPIDVPIDPFALPTPGIGNGHLARLVVAEPAVDIEQLDHLPEAIVQVTPRTPRIVQEQSVLAELSVDADGRVTNVQILSSDDRQLAVAVLAALRQWRFRPGLKDGHPVPFRMRQRFRFVP